MTVQMIYSSTEVVMHDTVSEADDFAAFDFEASGSECIRKAVGDLTDNLKVADHGICGHAEGDKIVTLHTSRIFPDPADRL